MQWTAMATSKQTANSCSRSIASVAIKVVAPQMAQTVTDRAIQIFGGKGVCDDVPLTEMFAINRYVRIADGPDEVHASQLGKFKIGQYAKPGAGWNAAPE